MIALDVETTGLDPRKCKPTHIGVYNGEEFSMGTLDSMDESSWELLKHRDIIGHNAKFDAHMIKYNTGHWLPWRIDTMLLSQLYDSRVKHKLDTLGQLYLGEGKWGDKKVLQAIKKGEFWMLPVDTQEGYLRRDCELTWRLFQFFKNNLSDKLRTLYDTFDLPVSIALAEVEMNGFTIDEELLDEYRRVLSDKLVQYKLELQHIFGDINFNSPKQLLGAIQKTTNFSLRNTDERTLSIVAKHDDRIGKIFGYREIQKYLGTYIDGEGAKGKRKGLAAHLFEGKVYPQYHLAGDYHTSTGRSTTTGRTSSSNPNLQNQPRSGNGPVNIRSLFIPSEGNTLLAFDYSQLELKVGAFLSGERNLLEGDIHANAASILKVDRSVGKTCNFALLYGAGKNKIFYTSGGSRHVDKYISWFEERFPKVISWCSEQQLRCRDEQRVETYLGRVRFMDNQEAGPNSVIQGSAGDIGKEAVLRVHKKGYRVVGFVHDEVLVEVPEQQVHDATSEIPIIMTEGLVNNAEIHNSVKLGVSVKQGKNWGQMKELSYVKN